MSKINRRPVRRTAAGVLASTLMLSGVVAAATPANAAPGFALDRIQGNDRYETSAAIATAFGTATNVILASGESGRTPDALAASFLAGVQNAPVLLTRRDTTPEPILAALRTLRTGGATTLTVVGGPVAISEAQLTSLRALGFTTVNRVAGADRFQTAAAIAAAGEGATASNVGLVASGVSTIDALAGGPLAFKGRHPLFLVTRTGVPAASLAAMRANGITSVYILGGEAVVGPQVAAQLTAAGITITGRLAGANRSETSVAIANALVTSFGFTNTTFNLASGTNEGIDALGGAALSGKQNRPLLITNNATSATPVVGYATARAATLNATGLIFGGPAVVAPALETQIETAGGGTGGGSAGITLTNTSAVAGSTFTGTLANPGTVQSVSVTGCGFNNQAVSIAAGGGFSLPLPAGQTVGACPLTFTVLRTDGSSTTQAIQFTVTAPASSTTAAPDLVSAAVNESGNTVTYTFDQNITGQVPDPGDFYIYNAQGTRVFGIGTPLASGSTVIVQFPTTTGTAPSGGAAFAVTGATLAAAADDAVRDAAGRSNYAASAPLGVQTQAAGITSGADLQTVENFRVQNANIVADFRFDAAVVATDAAVTQGAFQVVASDGTVYSGDPAVAPTFSVDARTVTVSFGGTTQVPVGSIVRGVVNAGAVGTGGTTAGTPAGNGPDNLPNTPDDVAAVPGNLTGVNVTQTEPRTGTPAFTTGATADRTDDPDLASVAVAGTDTVAFTFDEPVNIATAGNFRLYTAGGAASATGDVRSAVVSGTNTSVVNVTFAPGLVGNAVGVQALAGAVVAVDNTQVNPTHEIGLQAISNTAGRTALPDLVSVAISSDQFGVNSVVYTFDQAVAGGVVPTAGEFGLVDANGTVFFPGNNPSANVPAGNFNTARTTVTFTGATGANGFTNAQAASAVIGNVEDLAGGTVDVTTGDVPVQRS